MKSPSLLSIILLSAFCGLRAQCDLYIGNVGPGNCILLLFSNESEKSGSPLSIDAGGMEESKTKEFLDYLGEQVIFKNARVSQLKGGLLWNTHWHQDHFNLLANLKLNQTLLLEKFSFAVYNKNGQEKGKDSLSALSEKIKRSEVDWENGNNSRQEVQEILDTFCEGLPKKEITKFRFLSPQEGYWNSLSQTDRDNFNSTSLVLGLEYNDVKVLFPGDAPGEMYDWLDEEDKEFVNNADILIAPHHGSEEKRNSLWYASNKRFCTFISGDPSYKPWKLPGLANFGVRRLGYFLRKTRSIFYANTKGEVLEMKTRFPLFITFRGQINDNGYRFDENFLGYHVKIKDEEEAISKKCSVFENLRDEEGKHFEKEIEIKALPERKCLVKRHRQR